MSTTEQRVAIVTGAARGIGAATAVRLAAQGRAVAVLDLDEAACKDTVEKITAAGGKAIAVGCDVSDSAQVEAAVARVAAELGAPTILVNNAGVLRDNLLFKMSESDWDTVMNVHLKGAFLMAKAVQKHMVDMRLGPGRLALLVLRARQPRPGQLLRRQGGPPGLHQDPRHRARQVRRHRQRGGPRLHRHRDDRADRRPGRHGLRGLPGRGRHPDPRAARRLPRGHRQRHRLLHRRRRGLRLRPGAVRGRMDPSTEAGRTHHDGHSASRALRPGRPGHRRQPGHRLRRRRGAGRPRRPRLHHRPGRGRPQGGRRAARRRPGHRRRREGSRRGPPGRRGGARHGGLRPGRLPGQQRGHQPGLLPDGGARPERGAQGVRDQCDLGARLRPADLEGLAEGERRRDREHRLRQQASPPRRSSARTG